MKAGTPTMGGLVIFTAIGIPYLILSDRDAASLAVFGTALACAAIGFADDWLKIVKAARSACRRAPSCRSSS